MRIIWAAFPLVFLSACHSGGKVYVENLESPESVLSDYIKSIVNGDTKYSMFYITGNWKEVKDLGVFGDILEGKSTEKSKRRFVELFSWKINSVSVRENSAEYSVAIKSPDSGYVGKRVSVLMGIEDENGNLLNHRLMTESEARDIVRHEKNLPMRTDKFTIHMKKNQYGWVVDYLDKGTQELSTFLNDS